MNGTIAVRDYKKGLALTTRVATPKGWTTVADLRVGDDVLAPNGLPTKVLSKSAVHDRPCYELTFSDGEKIVSDHVHDWVVSVMDASGAWSTKVKVEARALHDLMERLRVEGRTHSIVVENTAPIELPPAALPIDPYILGAWLGGWEVGILAYLQQRSGRCGDVVSPGISLGRGSSRSSGTRTSRHPPRSG